MVRFYLSFLALVWFSSVSFGESCAPQPDAADCFKCSSPVAYSYCVTKTEGSQNPDFLYYLHGLKLNEKSWRNTNDFPELMRQQWKQSGFKPPTVISVSFGDLWLLVGKNSSPASGLLDVFQRAVIPQIEASLGGLQGKRLLIGESMGGFNATQLILKSPQLFTKAAVLCPAITTISPFATPAEIKAYTTNNKANPLKVAQALFLSKVFIPDAATWKTVAPLELAPTLLNNQTPDLYLSCGLADDYGFYEGTAKFAEIGYKNLNHFSWHPISSGTHCVVDGESVAKFFSN